MTGGLWAKAGLAALLGSTMLAGAAWAEERRVALLIGNEAYPADVGVLENPHEDVDAVAAALTKAGFEPEDIIVVKDADQAGILQGVAEMTARLKEAQGEGVGFFYFSGHGGSTESAGVRENYLVPVGADIASGDQLPLLGVPLDGVIKTLHAIEAKANFIVIDACRNTLPVEGSKALGGPAGDKGFAPVPTRQGLYIAYATSDGATAPDDGAFGSSLAAQITAPGQYADRMFELVRREVAATRGGQNLPLLNPGLTEDFCFVSCPDEPPAPAAGEKTATTIEWRMWDEAVTADTREAYLEFAEAFPAGKFAEQAKSLAVRRPTAEERAAARSAPGGDAGAEAVERMVGAIEQLAAGLEGVARLGGIIDQPESISDFLNNADVYERRGDLLNARKMYERAIAQNVEAVDVHEKYAAILKAQEGLLGAREIYADLAASHSANPTVLLAAAKLGQQPERKAAYEAILEAHPNFAPALYEAALLWSLDVLGTQTNADKEAEKAALEAFRAADEAGQLMRWFADKALLEEWRAAAAKRWAIYENAPAADPITFSAMSHNGGWSISATPTEAALSISYRLEGEAAWNELGYWDRQDPRTGKPMPMQSFNLDHLAPAQTIEVKYIDANGNERGPFAYRFDPGLAFISGSRMVLEITNTSWVEGRDFDGRYLIYFTHLAGHNCALAKVEYGYEEGALDREWPLGECDPTRPGAVLDGVQIYEVVDEPYDSVSVRLTFKDGSTMPVNTILLRYPQ